MHPPESTQSYRLLIIDDNPTIHEDIRKILCPAAPPADMAEDAALIFGDPLPPVERSNFEIDSAYQGRDGLAMVEKALAETRPYSMAFVDVRMPPGWDGIETIQHIWKCHPELQVVICTAYSDHSWSDILGKLGKSDSLLILKKPFDNVEVLQLAHALTQKWVVTCQARQQLEKLESAVQRRTADLTRWNQELRKEIENHTNAEAALRESEERFRKFFDSAPVGLAILRADTLAFTDVNPSCVSLTGCSREELIGRSPQELGLPEDLAGFEEIIRTVRTGKPVPNAKMTLRRPDLNLRQTLISIVPLVLGTEMYLLASMLDTSDAPADRV